MTPSPTLCTLQQLLDQFSTGQITLIELWELLDQYVLDQQHARLYNSCQC